MIRARRPLAQTILAAAAVGSRRRRLAGGGAWCRGRSGAAALLRPLLLRRLPEVASVGRGSIISQPPSPIPKYLPPFPNPPFLQF